MVSVVVVAAAAVDENDYKRLQLCAVGCGMVVAVGVAESGANNAVCRNVVAVVGIGMAGVYNYHRPSCLSACCSVHVPCLCCRHSVGVA